MVTKRKRAAARPKTRTVYRTAPRKRRTVKTGYDKIAPAAATVALVAVNADKIRGVIKAVDNNGYTKPSEYPARFLRGFTTKGWVNDNLKKFITADALTKDAIAIAGGYLGGELFRKYAPAALKKPVAKIAKKIPKVI